MKLFIAIILLIILIVIIIKRNNSNLLKRIIESSKIPKGYRIKTNDLGKPIVEIKRRLNGDIFTVIDIEKIPKQKIKNIKKIAEKKMIKNNPVPELMDIQPGIRNLKEAKDYLVDKIKGLTFSEIENTDLVYKLAKQFNIQFTNLK